jgi:heptosyltransferase III
MVKDAVPLGECGRALVVKLASPTDVLLAGPVLSVLKTRGVETDVLIYDDAAAMVARHPDLSRLHLVGRSWRREFAKELHLFQALRERAYALLVHLCDQVRGAWLARMLGTRYSVAPRVHRGRFWRRSFTHLYPVAHRRHEVELNLDALRRIGVYPAMDERKVRFVPGADAERKVERLVKDAFIQVHASPGWPADKHAALIERLVAQGCPVVVTSMPEPQALAFVDQVLQKTGARVLSLAGQLSLEELGALAARARLFIGGESVAMQLAACMGTAVVGLCAAGGVERAPWNVAHRALPDCSPVDAVHASVAELLAS